MKDICYWECGGVRVPSDWTVEMLKRNLERRKWRFRNEDELIHEFEVAKIKEDRQKLLYPTCKIKVGKTCPR